MDIILFRKLSKNGFIIVEIYIIVGFSNKTLCHVFYELMHTKFKTSMIERTIFF